MSLSWDVFFRYVISTLVTFLAGFAIVVVPQLDNITLQNFNDGVVVGIVFAGARMGIKMVLELFLAWYNRNKVV